MKLILDFGNTNVKLITKTKVSFIKNNKDKNTIEQINEWMNINNFKQCLIINVGMSLENLKYLNCEYKIFNNLEVLEYVKFDNNIKKFGADRIANIVAIIKQKLVQNNYIIFDFGTYLTIDVITNNKYDTGRITLGISKQLEQICNHSEKMTLTPEDILKENNVNTTAGQIKQGLVEQYNVLIAYYVKTYPNHQVIITGHDLHLIEKNEKLQICENLLAGLL